MCRKMLVGIVHLPRCGGGRGELQPRMVLYCIFIIILLFLFTLLGKQLKELAKEVRGKAAVGKARKCSGL